MVYYEPSFNYFSKFQKLRLHCGGFVYTERGVILIKNECFLNISDDRKGQNDFRHETLTIWPTINILLITQIVLIISDLITGVLWPVKRGSFWSKVRIFYIFKRIERGKLTFEMNNWPWDTLSTFNSPYNKFSKFPNPLRGVYGYIKGGYFD